MKKKSVLLILVIGTFVCFAQDNSQAVKDSISINVPLYPKFKLNSNLDFPDLQYFPSNNFKRIVLVEYGTFVTNNSAKNNHSSGQVNNVNNSNPVYQSRTRNSLGYSGQPDSWNYNAWGNPPSQWDHSAIGEAAAGILYELSKRK